jgi:hypothetical protein
MNGAPSDASSISRTARASTSMTSSNLDRGPFHTLDRRGWPLFSRCEARLLAESRQLGSLESRRLAGILRQFLGKVANAYHAG